MERRASFRLVRATRPAAARARSPCSRRPDRPAPSSKHERARGRRRLRPSGTWLRPGRARSRWSSGRLGSLAAPLQDAAAAPSGFGRAAARRPERRRHLDRRRSLRLASSRHRARIAAGRAPRRRGRQPRRSAYVFGGGNGPSQLDEIVKVDPSGRASVVGRLPQPASDVSAAVIAGKAYVVGGFTGTRWLNTILSWTPGSAPRVVGAAACRAALRGGDRGRRQARDRRRVDAQRNRQPGGARVRPRASHAEGDHRAAGAGDACRRRDAARDRVRDRRPRRDGRLGRPAASPRSTPRAGACAQPGSLAEPRSDLAAVDGARRDPAGRRQQLRRHDRRGSASWSPRRAPAPRRRRPRPRTSTPPTRRMR